MPRNTLCVTHAADPLPLSVPTERLIRPKRVRGLEREHAIPTMSDTSTADECNRLSKVYVYFAHRDPVRLFIDVRAWVQEKFPDLQEEAYRVSGNGCVVQSLTREWASNVAAIERVLVLLPGLVSYLTEEEHQDVKFAAREEVGGMFVEGVIACIG